MPTRAACWLALWLSMAGNGLAAERDAALESLAASYAYLVGERDADGGALYRADDGRFKGLAVPYSFTDSVRYWGEYVCGQPATDCQVSDDFDAADYALKPRPGNGALLQTERVNVHNGTNIYDAATWQIAVVLGSVVNHFGNPLKLDAYELASNQNRVLTANRATTTGARFLYNGVRISDPKAAYAFRMSAPAWLAPDPLKDSEYAGLIHVGTLPRDNPRYQRGLLSWSDWKPITGENAWAFLIGPLQAAYLHYVVDRQERFVPFEELSVQSAIAVLPAFAAMQSALGAIYYAPAGTLQNAANSPVDPHRVSIENNLSVLAGLRILRATLADETRHQSTLTATQRALIAHTTTLIDTMLAGGSLPGERRTQGLQRFLRAHAWRDGEFVQAGTVSPSGGNAWRAVSEPKAVDVNTWGVAALGSKQIDAWFGFGAAFRLWQSLQRWGACGQGHTLWGVGYSDLDGNGRTAAGEFRSGVLSAEWTAGAILMLRNMIAYYSRFAAGSPEAERVREWLVSLRADEQSLRMGLQQLRVDRYLDAHFPGKPADYARLLARPGGAISLPYLYASRRIGIPFGWNGNPLPSTSSTAWAILVADHYDPFGYGGKPN